MNSKKRKIKDEQFYRKKQKKKQKRRKRAVVIILEIIILLLLSGAAYAVLKYDKFQTVKIDKEDIKVNSGVEKKEGYTTIALFGGDSRDGELEKGAHTDCIIIVSIDNKTKEVRMASVYRDTLLQQMDNTLNKANHGYFNGGPEEAINMLNKNLDLDIENYATVDFKALVDTIDLLGGIDINVESEEIQYLNQYLQETADVAGTKANFITEPGEQHLDGAQAVTYARIRSTQGSDYKRTERQRLVIEKIFEQVLDTNLGTINKIIDTVFEQVSTSFSIKDLVGLASGVTKYKLGENTGFPFDVDDSKSYNNAGSVVIALGLKENVKQLHAFLYPNEEFQEASSKVQQITDEISYATGVVRPAELDQTNDGSEDGIGDNSGAGTSTADENFGTIQ